MLSEQFLDILAQFGGGRGDPANLPVRFLLPAFFWMALMLISWRQWRSEQLTRDLYICLAAGLGLIREVVMFVSEYGSWLGYFSFASVLKFFPPFEHALTMLTGLFISYAFINYFKVWECYARSYLLGGTMAIGLLYLIIATAWPDYLTAHPGSRFGIFWGDMAFRVTASLLLGAVLLLLLSGRRQGCQVPGMLFMAILGRAGYVVTEAADGDEALMLYKTARATSMPFDLVVMDLTIPGGKGGKETMAELLEFDPDARVIVSSGYANDPTMANYADYGFKGVVTKPYRSVDLSRVVHQVLNKNVAA
jgi:CheY-like chemotaxis protein